MTRWDYKRVTFDVGAARHAELDAALAELGADGWEVSTSFTLERHGHTHELHLVLKRPRVDG